MDKRGGMVIDVHQGDALSIGDDVRVQFLAKSGRITRVHVSAPQDQKIIKDSAVKNRRGDKTVVPSMAN